jgi:hypothetical protein
MITTYTELQNELADWLHRTDLTAKLPTFIQLAEAKLASNIKSRKLEAATTLTTLNGTATLPVDYDSLKSIQVDGAPNSVLSLLPVTKLLKYNSNNDVATPQFFAIQQDSIIFSPTPTDDTLIDIVYYKTLAKLSGTNPTNWVLDKFPYVYLYGSLIEACVYINDPDQIQFYQGAFASALSDMYFHYTVESFTGSSMSAQSDYVVDDFS